jgi:hypothetical protein
MQQNRSKFLDKKWHVHAIKPPTRISHGSVVIQLTFQNTTKEECVGITLFTAESSDAKTFVLHYRPHFGKKTRKRKNYKIPRNATSRNYLISFLHSGRPSFTPTQTHRQYNSSSLTLTYQTAEWKEKKTLCEVHCSNHFPNLISF